MINSLIPQSWGILELRYTPSSPDRKFTAPLNQSFPNIKLVNLNELIKFDEMPLQEMALNYKEIDDVIAKTTIHFEGE